ncbi:hypothetical protein [Ekhidna sp.]|jgi:hypothetical protein|uniref:hypothetical protein n=1 Tax=Ekhidna sp. TaxID=2608089 RepID=UPI0032EAED5C
MNKRIVENLSIRKIFLIDSIGALLSAVLLGLVFVHYQYLIGMPVHILQVLAGVAVLFMLYSFSCYYINPVNAKARLRTIAIANLLYCVTTLILMGVYFDELTLLGFTYFILEILVITFLARFEFKSTYHQFHKS